MTKYFEQFEQRLPLTAEEIVTGNTRAWYESLKSQCSERSPMVAIGEAPPYTSFPILKELAAADGGKIERGWLAPAHFDLSHVEDVRVRTDDGKRP